MLQKNSYLSIFNVRVSLLTSYWSLAIQAWYYKKSNLIKKNWYIRWIYTIVTENVNIREYNKKIIILYICSLDSFSFLTRMNLFSYPWQEIFFIILWNCRMYSAHPNTWLMYVSFLGIQLFHMCTLYFIYKYNYCFFVDIFTEFSHLNR